LLDEKFKVCEFLCSIEFLIKGVIEFFDNSISPGFILQEEHRTLFEGPGNIKYRATAIGSIPLGRVGTADEIAKTAFYLASPESSFITGQDIIVDGGSTIREHLDLLQERELR